MTVTSKIWDRQPKKPMLKEPMPAELQNYINSLPSSRVNSAREIIRRTWERVSGKDPKIIHSVMLSLGIDLSFDDHYNISDPEDIYA